MQGYYLVPRSLRCRTVLRGHPKPVVTEGEKGVNTHTHTSRKHTHANPYYSSNMNSHTESIACASTPSKVCEVYQLSCFALSVN